MKKQVVITGIGIITALGRGIGATGEALRQGISGISEIKSFDISRHRTRLGGEVKNNYLDDTADMFSDRASQLVCCACKDAFTDASLELSPADSPETVLVVLGTTLGGMLAGQEYHTDLLLHKDRKPRLALLQNYLSCNQAAHIAKMFNLPTEALILNNACASGLSAIGYGYLCLRSGEASVVVTGGYDVMSEFTHAGFSALQLVTQEICRPFDKNRSGLILGEGSGILILEEMSHAKKRGARIVAEILGYGQTSDAYHITKPDPEARGASGAIAMALQDAGVLPEEIDYVNAHGTGTLANDSMESKALYQALGIYAEQVPVSSTKPFTGHMLGAAGAAEVIFSAIAIASGILPENLNYTTPDPDCNLNIITKGSRKADVRTVLSNSFGFGGSNAAVVLRKA